ncbi:cytochrome c1, heme protein, mitochondrial-like [Phymastichus coffea]|uniref:cytochrome c1, heme protein, mitochondrial-like n=1 Tax=Phymastichus coffea TaxID=108790 RepID=UPI00273B5761|nr:cytochrome c1, heme protein, mitochondrial-like [Phymastichus coffea]
MWRRRGLRDALVLGRDGLGLLVGALASGAAAAVVYALESAPLEAAHVAVRPPEQLWSFRGALSSLDHSAVRRGWQVYKAVCSGCHSLRYVCYRQLVGVCLTEGEAREAAAEQQVRDGPDQAGEYFTRSGKLQDSVPEPYPNEEAARAANEGALPVDLSYVVNARHHGPDYVFGLLTGYTEPPAGVELREGQAYNVYFDGGALGMGEILQDGLVDYEDGTPATKSQMAKDVVEFLMWTSNQEWEARKLLCFRAIILCTILGVTVYSLYRQRMSHIKNTKICFIPKSRNKC